MKEKNKVEELLEKMYPKHGELQVDDEGGLYTIVVDQEMDGFICKFNHDDGVEIDTDEYSYINLDRNTLILLAKLILEAEEIYDNRTEEEWKKYG